MAHHGLSDTVNYSEVLITVTLSPVEPFPANVADGRWLLHTTVELLKVRSRIAFLGKFFGAH